MCRSTVITNTSQHSTTLHNKETACHVVTGLLEHTVTAQQTMLPMCMNNPHALVNGHKWPIVRLPNAHHIRLH